MVTVQRPDDMSPDGFLRISDNGNSFTLTTFTSEDTMSEFIEFCTSLGGGRSLNTLSAIENLLTKILKNYSLQILLPLILMKKIQS